MIVADFTGKGDTQTWFWLCRRTLSWGGVTLQLLTANDGEFRSTQTLNLGEGRLQQLRGPARGHRQRRRHVPGHGCLDRHKQSGIGHHSV